MIRQTMQGFLERAMREPIAEQMAEAGGLLLPGNLLDLNRRLLFGETTKAIDPQAHRALIILGLAGRKPMLGWRLESIPINEVVTVVCTALGLMAERNGPHVLVRAIGCLELLLRKLEASERTKGEGHAAG
jgi:hypothetical protein